MKRRLVVCVFVLLALLSASCTSFGGNQSSSASSTPDVKPTTFTDDQYHWTIDSPGPMNRKSKTFAAYYGPEERLEVTVVEGAAAADPAGLADKDMSALKSSISDFKLVTPPATVTLGGQSMVKVTYTGTVDNPSSGKQIKLTFARYYIAKSSSLLAVVTYGDQTPEFDPKEADDIARSFHWQ